MDNSNNDYILDQLDSQLNNFLHIQKQGIEVACFSEDELIKFKPILNLAIGRDGNIQEGFLDSYNSNVLKALDDFLITESDIKEIKDWILINKSSKMPIDDVEIQETLGGLMYKHTGFTAAIIGIIIPKNEIYMIAFDSIKMRLDIEK